ncbi:MAG: AAA+ superfamily predicted ATPase [Myxococcota bacterium]
MDFLSHIDTRLKRTVRTLSLSPLSREVLRILALVDCKEELAEDLRKADAYDRPGVLSWRTLAEQVPSSQNTLLPLEQAVIALADWGLIQIVGRAPTDPVAPGPAALRLTFSGRVCMGLAPAGMLENQRTDSGKMPWGIFHGASREYLLEATYEHLGSGANHPIIAQPGGEQELARLCGQVAVSLCTLGGAVVDGFPTAENTNKNLTPQLLYRTRTATAPRVLILPEPGYIRTTAIAVGARMRWVEPAVQARRGKMVLDSRITKKMVDGNLGEGEGSASITGVPDSDLGAPKRCDTAWEDLILADNVRWQMEQAMLHAQYRLNTLPKLIGRQTGYRLLLSGLPGTGKSMGAEALATALNRPLVKLDLSTVLSKWLGETEKLLGQVFDIAESAGAVLVLDEAESILRQRSSGAGGGGGGMGTGVAYMLTRLDSYAGVLVATTNRIEDLDEAFFRRFDDYVVLPIPDRPTRRFLWQRMLKFEDDDDVDFDIIAANFPISGGLIRGAAIRANAWASGANQRMTTPYVLASLARELEKNNRSTNEVYAQPYRDAVQELLEGRLEEADDDWG